MTLTLETTTPPAPNRALEVRDLIKKYRVKVSPHLGKLMKESEAVAKQFFPDPREKLDFGTERPFEEGRNYRGVYGLERIYEDRAVITPYFECAAYCRYCFKKTRTLAGEAQRMSDQDILRASLIIRNDSAIKTVLITGGDPLMDIPLLRKVLESIKDIPKAMLDILTKFSQIGILPYYLFHCMPVTGSLHFRTSVQRGIDILKEISPLTGAMALHYVYVTPVGKHRVGSVNFDRVEIAGESYLRAKTPYRAEEYFRHSGTTSLPEHHSVSDDGFIVSNYLDGQD